MTTPERCLRTFERPVAPPGPAACNESETQQTSKLLSRQPSACAVDDDWKKDTSVADGDKDDGVGGDGDDDRESGSDAGDSQDAVGNMMKLKTTTTMKGASSKE